MKSDPVLIITKKQGQRATTVYHGELSTLKELDEFSTDKPSNPRQLRVDIRYSFLVSIRPSRWQTLYFLLEDGSCVSLKLECDDAFLKVLREALAYLRSNASAAEEEETEADEAFEP